uniref:cathepsin Q-like isoform X2 n=1 Tax=Arvicanthis niloticus TaxID=61156 RepID=UPI0014869C50|nr:cathepsin Q-like isoform X2 [Arvicanthis niloticus]
MTPAVFLVILCLGVVSGASEFDLSLDVEWEEWKIKYGKSYTPEEDVLKREVWEENVKRIKLHNMENSLGKNTYTMEVNDFADLTDEEFKNMITGFTFPINDTVKSPWKGALHNALPKSVNWLKEGYVTRVNDQGKCKSCWAFPVTGAIEAQVFKKTGKLIPLSAQNLVDCSKPQGNRGCRGGTTYNAFQYVLQNGGLEAETTYPYKAKEGVCRYNPNNSLATITTFVPLSEDEDVLMDAVATKGPVAAGINVVYSSLRFYKKGIYHEPRCKRFVNHAVLVIGYGFDGNEEDGKNYWLIKNSWGKQWGLGGYMKLAKDKNNHCGIATFAQYPII